MSGRTALLHDYEEALSFLSEQLGDDWTVRRWRDGNCCWQFHAPSAAADVAQGWKVHVAVAVSEAAIFARTLAPLLAELRVPFKLPASLDAIAAINAGEGGAEQVGKIATLYPANDAHARKVIHAVDRLWPKSAAPAIRTSLHVRPGSAVAFRFGAFDARNRVVDSRGIIHAAVRLPDGDLVADERIIGGKPPAGIEPPLPGFAVAAWDEVAGKPMAIDDLNLVVLGEIKQTAHGRLLFAADRDSGATLVVRQRLPGATRYPDDGSAEEHIAREFQALNEIAGVQGCAPRAIACYGGEMPCVAMEDVAGNLLTELPQSVRMQAMPSMAKALAEVHRRDWVHGDVKLENAIVRDGTVTLIDFELAERIGSRLSGRGTDAYMPPEATNGAPAHPAQDIYALGVSLFHAVTGFPPGLLAAQPGILADLLRREGAREAADVVDRMTAADPLERPSAEACIDLLTALNDEGASSDERSKAPSSASLDDPRLHLAIKAAVEATAKFRIEDGGARYWRNAHFQRHFECEAINIGAAGILIGLLVASGTVDVDCRDDIAGTADWLASRPADGQAAGLFTGNAGVALALAVAGRALGTNQYLAAARARLAAAAADDRELDLFSGSAGTLFAAAAMSELIEDDWPLDLGRIAIRKLEDCRTMVEDLTVWRVGESAGADFLGCAHGSAGIAAALGYWARRTGDPDAAALSVATLKGLARREMDAASGQGMRMRLDSDQRHAPGNWCHGTAGFLWSVLAGPGADCGLAEEIDWAVASLAELPAIATPTYCHGLAGQLELWQMISAMERHRRLAADKIGRLAASLDFMRIGKGGRDVWISDDPSIVTPDLWVGFMGPAAALALAVQDEKRTLLDGGLLRDAADRWGRGRRGGTDDGR
jgi:tRNA A-37 threonylcarbamoyl transferase component Bud32